VWLEGIKGAPGEDAGPGFPGRKGDRGEPGIPGREGKTFFNFNVQMTGVSATATLLLSVFVPPYAVYCIGREGHGMRCRGVIVALWIEGRT